MKIRELLDKVRSSLLDEEIEICKEQLKIRKREIRRLKKLLKDAEANLETFLEKNVEDIADEYEHEY